jgi:E3 ubiquitin-protein ligase synoviolin
MMVLVYYAYYTRRQFYPTVLFLVSSKISFIIAGNLALATSLVVAKMVKSIYFGSLRELEAEILIEKAKYSIIETCLALTIFRNELSPGVLGLFGSLILFKLMHKLSKTRLEYMEQIAPVPLSLKTRMGFLLVTLLIIDLIGVFYSVRNVMAKGRSVIILFGFEFGLLLIYALNLSIKYVLNLIDDHLPNGLQSKGFCVMVSDLICEIIKVLTYVALFSMIFVYYGLPFHLIRDVWAAYHSFQRKLLSFIKYLRLTQNLDSRFPDATPEEITAAGSCIVCREELHNGKKLKCGHIFHLECLRMWLQHQQSCPTCR